MDTRKLLFISKLAIVLVLLYTGGSTLMVHRDSAEVFSPASAGGGEREGAFQADASAGDGAEDLSAIVERSIFGAAGQASGQGGSDYSSAATELGIELVGTVAGTPAVSRAIIKNTETKTLGLYSIGQAVAGATIEGIRLNTVDLLHNGEIKTLTLKAAQAYRRVGSSKSSEGKTQAARKASTYLPASRVSPKSDAVGQSKVGYIEEILSKAIIEPYAVNGKVEGLKVTGLDKVPAAMLLGLKDGDIVRHVNGQQLTSLQKAFQVFQKAKSQPAISLEFSRDGEIKELTFDLH